MSRFAASIKQAAERSPMGNAAVPIVHGRVLNIDGDGLAYYCAGNKETDPGTARRNLVDKIDSAKRAARADRVRLLLTANGSDKGKRYAIARVKPYQGQRSGEKPKNWEYLRQVLESRTLPYEIECVSNCEADDMFAFWQNADPDCVTMTHDKDMRMVPGWHMTWVDHIMIDVRQDFAFTHNDKLYGHKWFWMQMLMGDTVDNIPGLPGLNYTNAKGEAKVQKVGEVNAAKILADVTTNETACITVLDAYRNWYAEDATLQMLEQACLLWIRKNPTDPFDVLRPGNPLAFLMKRHDILDAKNKIQARIDEADGYGKTEDDASSGDALAIADSTGRAVQAVPATVLGDGSGAGSLPRHGVHTGDASPGVQQPARQDREQLPPVRREVPARVPAWVRALLATPRNAATRGTPPDVQDC